jgi:hypothetical protein
MHTSNSFTDIKSTSLYYNTTSKSAGHTKIIEEGMIDPVSAISEIRDPDKIRR